MNQFFKKMLQPVLLFFIFFPYVLPNSLREITVPLFVIVGVLSIIVGFRRIGYFPFYYYICLLFITLVYLLVGLNRSSPGSLQWIVFVYIFSPLCWICIFSLLYDYGVERYVKFSGLYSFLGCLSVFLYYYLFLTNQEALLSIFVKDGNANAVISDGKFAATMHVYGSLIFFASAIISVPGGIFKPATNNILIFLFIVVSFISGRSALLLSVFIGFVLRTYFSSFRNIMRNSAYATISLLAVAAFATIWIEFFYDRVSFDALLPIIRLFEKVSSGGGEERQDQFFALVDGILRSGLMGNGLGVPASIIRNTESPWKYELLGLSTLFSVGIIGFIFYVLPFLMSLSCFFKLKRKDVVNNYDMFMFSGLVGIFIASNTNPYLLSFEFQWTYVSSALYFYRRWCFMRCYA